MLTSYSLMLRYDYHQMIFILLPNNINHFTDWDKCHASEIVHITIYKYYTNVVWPCAIAMANFSSETEKKIKKRMKFTWEFWCLRICWYVREIPVESFSHVPRRKPTREYFPPGFCCCFDWNGENGFFYLLWIV